MSNFKITGNISGSGHQFGDNYFMSAEGFIDGAERKFTETEKELVRIIFEHAPTEDDRRQLLVTLQDSSTPVKEERKSIWESLQKTLLDKGLTLAASIVGNFITKRFCEGIDQL